MLFRSPRLDHGAGQPQRLVEIHSTETDRHRQRGHLVIGQRAVREAGDEEADFFLGQRVTVTFPLDDLGGEQHGENKTACPERSGQAAVR